MWAKWCQRGVEKVISLNKASASSASQTNKLTKKHKKEIKPFLKDVILLTKPTEMKTLTGFRKAKAFELGVFFD